MFGKRCASLAISGIFILGAMVSGQNGFGAAMDAQRASNAPGADFVPTYSADSILIVTAFRDYTPVRKSHFAVSRLDTSRFRDEAGATIDDILRFTPGFSLYRRSSSDVANPTTQGVTLRGLGASGASRTLVLYDNAPLNDPFGGWVYWNRINMASLHAVEIVRGGASAIYGTDPLGGVVHVLPNTHPHQKLFMTVGDAGVFDISFSQRKELRLFKKWPLDFQLEAKKGRQGEYYKIPLAIRGNADEKANAEYVALGLNVSWTRKKYYQTIRANVFKEERNNGTKLQRNDTETWFFSTHVTRPFGNRASAEGYLALQKQAFHQTFSAVSEDRSDETLTRRQSVPSRFLEAGLIGRFHLGKHELQNGIELKYNEGASDETALFNGQAESKVAVGGNQDVAGIFVQDRIALSTKLNVVVASRFDVIANRQEDSTLVDLSSGMIRYGELASNTFTACSPRLSFSYGAHPRVFIRGAFYRSFRAPTLNELYRGFRVGDAITRPNSFLQAEKATGGELGVDLYLLPQRAGSISMTMFSVRLDDAIANVTKSIDANLIYRQRENLGAIHSTGFEVELAGGLSPWFRYEGNYVFTQSLIKEAADETIINNRVPQVPEHTMNLRVVYQLGKLTSTVRYSHSSGQFDDDQNQFYLERYNLWNLSLRYELSRRLALKVFVENITNAEIQTARTPSLTIGPPRRYFLALEIF